MIQILIGLNGVLSTMFLAIFRNHPKYHKWGSPIGLLGQPFWIKEFLDHQLNGMLLCSILTTFVFLYDCARLIYSSKQKTEGGRG